MLYLNTVVARGTFNVSTVTISIRVHDIPYFLNYFKFVHFVYITSDQIMILHKPIYIYIYILNLLSYPCEHWAPLRKLVSCGGPSFKTNYIKNISSILYTWLKFINFTLIFCVNECLVQNLQKTVDHDVLNSARSGDCVDHRWTHF